MRALWVGLLLATVAAPAVALPPEDPGLTFTTIGDGPLVKPQTGFGVIEIHYAWSCTQAELLGGPGSSLNLSLAVESPVRGTSSLSPSSFVLPTLPPEQCMEAGPRHWANTSVKVVVGGYPLAFEPLRMKVHANLTHNSATGESTTWGPWVNEVRVVPDYNVLVQFRPLDIIQNMPGNLSVYVVQVRSWSNDATRISTALNASSSGRDSLARGGFGFTLPDPFVMPAYPNGTKERSISITVHGPPEPDPGVYAFDIDFHAERANRNASSTFNATMPFSFKVGSPFDDVIPGPSPWLPLGLVGIWAWRRRTT